MRGDRQGRAWLLERGDHPHSVLNLVVAALVRGHLVAEVTIDDLNHFTEAPDAIRRGPQVTTRPVEVLGESASPNP